MIRISDRLQTIAHCVTRNETVADIGTDHGLLPIFLWQTGISRSFVLSDVNAGPLEKAQANLKRYGQGMVADLRLGNGLAVLRKSEVDTVVIAGMGGLLITEILEQDLSKATSFGKYILQPRNAQERVREWLYHHGFTISAEHLVREGNYICEVIVASPRALEDIELQSIEVDSPMENELAFEVSPLLFHQKDPLLIEFLERKKRVEEQIVEEIMLLGSEQSKPKAHIAQERAQIFERLIQKAAHQKS